MVQRGVGKSVPGIGGEAVKYKYWWQPNVVRVIRAYPSLKERKAEIQSQSVTANYTPSPRAGGTSRSAENTALRSLAPAEEEALEAVETALEQASLLKDGEKVQRLIRRYYWGRGEGFLFIADAVGLSERTARRRNAQFIRNVAKNLKLF